MYCLISENLTGLGGAMGTEKTWNNFERFYKTLKKAKAEAVKDYKKPLRWIKTKTGLRTEDLSYVMYHIDKIVPE